MQQSFDNQREEELFYCLCLLSIPKIGVVKAKTLVENYYSARAAWDAIWVEEQQNGSLFAIEFRKQLENKAYQQLRIELEGGHHFLLYNDPDYPTALWFCPDAPLVLYYKGQIPTWSSISISLVGTRNMTAYGKDLIREFIRDIAPLRPLIVSGAAAGIDGEAHRLCIEYDLPTIALLGHGLQYMYPASHRQLAYDIVQHQGALITEFPRQVSASKSTFLQRNRLVAAWSSATVVIESGIPGGSLATARLAHEYGREVFTFPGRVGDEMSKGCLDLAIRDRARLIRDAADFIEYMGWQLPAGHTPQPTIEIPYYLKALLEVMEIGKATQRDEWFRMSGLSLADFSALVLELEMLDYISVLPGNWYMRKF